MLSKKTFFSIKLTLLLLFPVQSTSILAAVRPYGIFDSGVSLINNGHLNSISLTSGTGTAARLGVRGNETINASLSAEFLIETFITMDDGSNYGMESIYNSATFVGFNYKEFVDFFDAKAEFSIRLGRQRSILHDRLYLYDPMRQNLIGSPTGFAMYSMFYNKMIKMVAKIRKNKETTIFRFMFIPGNYNESLKEQYLTIGDSHKKTPFGTWGVSARWDKKPFSIKTGYQIEKKTSFREQNDSFLSVIRYSISHIDFYGGYLRRSPGRQIFLSGEENIKTECFYLGFGMPLKKLLPDFNVNSSIYFSYAHPKMKSLIKLEGGTMLTEQNYFAHQWGIGIKKPLSKKTALYFFAGEIQNSIKSKFSLEAIPYDIPSALAGGNPSVIGFSLNQRY